MQLSPLLQLLQQQEQQAPQQRPWLEVPFAQASQEYMQQQPPQMPNMPGVPMGGLPQFATPPGPNLLKGVQMPSFADTAENAYANVNPLGKLGAMGARMGIKAGVGAAKTGMEAVSGSVGELLQSNPGLMKELGVPGPMASAFGQQKQGGAPPVQPMAGGDEPQDGGLFDRLNAEKAQSNQGFGMIPPGINDAVQDSVKQYGIAQDDFEQAQFALKQEFQDTPEIDNALNSAHQMLAEARANRKQPSAWDFIAMALMNLSGIHPATSAAMVLGLDDQGRREGMLEDRIFGLEDARSGAKMQGRRDLRGMEMQQGMAQQEAQQRAQEMQLRQANLDREFGFKQQDQSVDLMRSLAGQASETERTSMDGNARKKAATERDLLRRVLQMDDDSLNKMLKQRQQTQPKDQRQSRMFGGLIGDSFA
jgi:hypothetical protein